MHTAVVKAIIFAVILVGVVVVAVVVDLPGLEELRRRIDSYGAWAPSVFVVGYAVITLTPLPKNVLSALAGVTFGLVGGFVLVYLGAMAGAMVSFWIGRALGREAVERFTKTRFEKIDRVLARRGLLAMIGVRLIPVIPFTAINYGAPLTAMRQRDYVIGTGLGIIPGTVAFVALGAGAASGNAVVVAVAAGVLIALSAAAALYGARSRSRNRAAEARRTI